MLPMLPLLVLLLLAPVAQASPAVEGRDIPSGTVPAAIASPGEHLLYGPVRNGLMIRVPVFSYDPNSGATYGLAAAWLVTNSSSTIRLIHAPSFTYNPHFGATASYDFFYFFSPRTSARTILSLSQYWNRQAAAEFQTSDFRGSGVSLAARVEQLRDGSRRFYGLGPSSSRDDASNYTLDTINYAASAGVPLSPDGALRLRLRNSVQADEIEGSFPPLPDTVKKFPEETRGLQGRKVNVSNRATLAYDTRDGAEVPAKGTDAELFYGVSHHALLSAYNYIRYGASAKAFFPEGADSADPPFIAAVEARFENINGTAPFWLMSQLGGKFSLRAYGDGRFVDHSMAVVNFEQRCRLYSLTYSGVPLSFWADPFIGAGTVAREPDILAAKTFHPAAGIAFRVVSRPQVVESLDFAYGQEGLQTFLDFKYSF